MFQNKPARKLFSLIAIDILVWVLVSLLFVPHTHLEQEYTWEPSSLSTTESVTWNDTVYSHMSSLPLGQLPKGSYDLDIIVSNPVDNDVIRVQGNASVSSIYSIFSSCTLSRYSTKYTISFENYSADNLISLCYYHTAADSQNSNSLFAIQSIHLQSTSLMAKQLFGIFLLIVFPINLFALCWKKIDRKKWGLLIAVSVFAGIPLYKGYIFYGHDTLFHLSRIEGLKSALLAGQFPVRVSAAQFNEYGYISSALYPELLLYFPAVLRLLNLSIPTVYCIFWFCINLLTAYIAWHSFYGFTGDRTGAFIGTILFTLFPYRLVAIYLRGAFGEALALTFFPLVLWGIYEIFYGDFRKWPIAVIGYSGILQCHILTVTSTVIISIIWGLLNTKVLLKEKKRIFSILALTGSVFFLNLWFLVPFLMLYRLPLWVKYITNNFLDHVLFFKQLFYIILPGSGNSYPLNQGTGDEMPFSIGLGAMIGIVVVAFSFLRCKFKTQKARNVVLICLIIAVFFFWTTTNLFPWNMLNQAFPFFSSFISNLPWRRLGIANLFLIAAITATVCQYTAQWRNSIILLITIGVLVSSGSFLVSFVETNGPYITNTEDYGTGSEDELYLYFGTDVDMLKQRGNVISLSSASVDICQYQKCFTNISLTYTNPSEETEWIDLPLNYFPGYTALTEEGMALSVTSGDNNVLRVELPANSSHSIKVLYKNCTLYQCATAISGIYLIIFSGYLLIRKRPSDYRGI